MKKIFVIIVITTFCLMTGITTDAEEVGKKVIAVKEMPAQSVLRFFSCPTGWTKKPNELVCVPSKPTAIRCPKGYEYYEALKCSAYEYGGCKATGCEIGCRIPSSHTPTPPGGQTPGRPPGVPPLY